MTESGPSFVGRATKFVKDKLNIEPRPVPGTTVVYRFVSAGPYEEPERETVWAGTKAELTPKKLQELIDANKPFDMSFCEADKRGRWMENELVRPGPDPNGEYFTDISA